MSQMQTKPKLTFTPAFTGFLRGPSINQLPTHEVPRIVHELLRSPGQQLDRETRAFMEPRFGHDFSQVRVHADAKAAESAQAVNALAYTVAEDVVFGAGQYAPYSRDGSRMLAHELTHVSQQRGIRNRLENLSLGPLNDAHEQAANQSAQDIFADRPVVTGSIARRTVQRQTTMSQEDSKQKAADTKTVVTQPAPQKIPATQVESNKKVDTKQTPPSKTETPNEEKKGIEKEWGLALETETKREEGKFSTEVAGKYKFGVTFPISDKLHIGEHLSFFKEAETEGAVGLHSSNAPPGSLTSLELEAAMKMISLDFEKVKVPLGLGVLDLGGSASTQAAFEYSPEESKTAGKFGVAAEGEAKYKRRKESPLFIKLNVGVEKTFDKEGNASFKWGPASWKTSATVGFEF
jgi:Domain of unknown function (DUF4157)